MAKCPCHLGSWDANNPDIWALGKVPSSQSTYPDPRNPPAQWQAASRGRKGGSGCNGPILRNRGSVTCEEHSARRGGPGGEGVSASCAFSLDAAVLFLSGNTNKPWHFRAGWQQCWQSKRGTIIIPSSQLVRLGVQPTDHGNCSVRAETVSPTASLVLWGSAPSYLAGTV